jgi:hypothetical protein
MVSGTGHHPHYCPSGQHEEGTVNAIENDVDGHHRCGGGGRVGPVPTFRTRRRGTVGLSDLHRDEGDFTAYAGKVTVDGR